MTNPTPVVLTSPTLLDLALGQIQTRLETITWLTTAYGKIERKERLKDTTRILFPGIYCGGGDYLSMFPDSHLGNFSFFEVSDRQEMEWIPRRNHLFTAKIGIVFWFDFRTVYASDHETSSLENVKWDVLSILNAGSYPNCRFTATDIEEQSENIYRGFTISEIENQFETRPYGGFRINGDLIYSNTCIET